MRYKSLFKPTLYLLIVMAMVTGLLSGCAQPTPAVEEPTAAATEPAEPTEEPVVEEPTAVSETDEPEEPAVPAADTVLKNGVVYTLVAEGETAQAVAVTDGEIVYVGDDAGVEDFIGEDTQVIDLQGAMVSPAFMDGHLHVPGDWMNSLFNVSLAGCKTNEDYVARVKDFVETHPDAPVVTGGQWSMNVYAQDDGTNPGPSKADLDAVAPDVPVILNSVDHHSVWVNSKALELAGITAETQDPNGGVISRDADGSPRGMLTDAAADLLAAVRALDVKTVDQYKEAILAFQEEVHSYGITGVTNLSDGASVSESGETSYLILEALAELEDEGKLTLRVDQAINVDAAADHDAVIATIADLRSRYESDLIRINTVKLFIDGVTEGVTAVFLEPYTPEAGKGDDFYGEPIWTDEDLFAAVEKYDAAGIQVHVHAIGDGAVRQILNAYEAAFEANGPRDARHTMTHVSAIANEDVERLDDLGVISALQFLWLYKDPLFELEQAMIGPERALAMYPTRNMLAAGAIMAGASDNPVTPCVVLDEIEVGVTRNSPYPGEDETDMVRWGEQALSAYDMLKIYTTNVAFEMFRDSYLGTIEVGKRADLVVLGDDITQIDPKAISDTPILFTLMDGAIVYQP